MKFKLFIKKFKTTQAAKHEFERTNDIYNKVKLATPIYLRIVKPVKFEGKTIYFEKITDAIDVRKLICRLHVDPNILYYVGKALAELHKAINPAIKTLDDNMHIHGDFTASNVLYVPLKNLVYIIDFAPYLSNITENYCFGPAYKSLAHMVLSLEIKYPMHKLYLLLRKYNRELSNKFFQGYEDAIGLKIDKQKLQQYLIEDIQKARSEFSRRNFFSSFIWTRIFDKAQKEYSSGKRQIYINDDYRQCHLEPQKALYYQDNVYGKNSAHSSLWKLEQQYLAGVITKYVTNKNKYLDFACGTGRVIESFPQSFSQSIGVDISESMLSIAKTKNIKAIFLQGDVTSDKNLAGDNFDFITAFRFFLNAQDSLAKDVIAILAKKLGPNGILVFNIHNSKPSFLALQNGIMNFFKKSKLPSLSRQDVSRLLQNTNLEIIEIKSFGILPKVFHILLRSALWCWFDKLLSKSETLQKIGSDVIYVCKHKN